MQIIVHIISLLDNYNNNNNVNNNENKDFVLLKNWVHIEDKEIIACNVYIIENQIKEDNNETKYNFNHAKIKKEREKQNNINTKNEIHTLKLIEGENSYDSYTASHNKILNYDKSSNNFDSNAYYKNIENIIKIEKTKNDCIKVNSNKLTNNNNIYKGKNKYYIITLDIEENEEKDDKGEEIDKNVEEREEEKRSEDEKDEEKKKEEEKVQMLNDIIKNEPKDEDIELEQLEEFQI